MRIGFFTECYRPIVNGVVASIDALRAGMRARGIDVLTIAPHMPNYAERADDIVRLASLPLPTSTGYRLCVPLLGARARRRLHGIDIAHAHSPFVTGWMALAYARGRDIPLVFTYHTRIDEYAHYAPFGGAVMRRAMVRLTRTFADAADVVIAPTQAAESRLRELGVRARIAVVPSAVDVARFAGGRRSAAVRALLGAAGERVPLALIVARLGREKQLELALDALAQVPAAHMAIVGAGPHRAALEARAAAVGVAERVRFTGALAPEVLPDVYASSDAFVFPSATETQGLVLAEALAAGLPIVATDVAATRDVLAGRGRLVPAEPAALAAALTAALAAGRDGNGASAARNFEVALFAERVAGLYAECRTFGTLRAQDRVQEDNDPG
jgi:1,2-diacylglycerol 3-alpha-glucosyltransferase